MTHLPAFLVKWFWIPAPTEGAWKGLAVWGMHKKEPAFSHIEIWWTTSFEWVGEWGWNW